MGNPSSIVRILAKVFTQNFASAVRFAFLLTLLLAPAIAYSQINSTPGGLTPEDHLTGVVMNAATHQPVSHALVVSSDTRYAAMTDDRGRFAFSFPKPEMPTPPPTDSGGFQVSIPQSQLTDPVAWPRPGMWSARKVGFLAPEGREFTSLQPDQHQLTLILIPEARVVGQILNQLSDGSDLRQVALYRKVRREGQEAWESADQVSTRSDGTFRFADLRPGFYKLLSLEHMDYDPLDYTQRARQFGYPPVYYPSAADFQSAAAIHLNAGETFQASLSPAKREYFPVKVPVTNASELGGPTISVWLQGRPGPDYALVFDPQSGAVQGSLPAGAYSVQVSVQGQPAMLGATNFTVASGAVSYPALSLTPGISIAVNVRQELQHPQDESNAQFRSNISRSDGVVRQINFGNAQVQLLPDQEFEYVAPLMANPVDEANANSLAIEGVVPGRYRVMVQTSIAYVAAVTSGGTDLLRQPLVIVPGGAVPSIEVTVRDDGAEIEGSVSSPTEAAVRPASQQDVSELNRIVPSEGTVFFLPADGLSRQPTSAAILQGHFKTEQVAPGTYQVLATDQPPQYGAAWPSEEYLKAHESKIQRIETFAGQKLQLQLSLVKGDE